MEMPLTYIKINQGFLVTTKVLKLLSYFGLLLFILITIIIWDDNIPFFDKIVAEVFSKYHFTFLNRLFIAITYLNNFESVLIISIFISILLIKKKRFKALQFYLLTIITAMVIKIYTMRSCPDNGLLNVDSYAFPSWHAALSIVLSLLIYILFMTVVFAWP